MGQARENLFRRLRADEIDCRVQTVRDNGCSVLLYKDARCDMNILDETFGPFNWKREHSRDNANCTVSVWDDDKKQWIGKEDTGTESNTEKEKGLASDSFKRACFNWGIGRELYTAPFIWVTPLKGEDLKRTKFRVSDIAYDEQGRITRLVIVDGKGVQRYPAAKAAPQQPAPAGKPEQPDYDPDLLLAKREMQEAKTMQEAVAVWDRWACFKHDEHFQREKERAKARLTMQQQSANQ